MSELETLEVIRLLELAEQTIQINVYAKSKIKEAIKILKK
jgi:hypothetical protein